jgi:hypothetical protein
MSLANDSFAILCGHPLLSLYFPYVIDGGRPMLDRDLKIPDPHRELKA